MITIGIIDDNAQIAESLSEVLQLNDNFKIDFIAVNGEDLMAKLKKIQPQILIMDIQMPVMNGIEAVRQVKENYPQIKILMHTVINNDQSIIESIFLGANGYILKNEKPQKLIDAINDVMEGGAPITPSMAQKLIKYFQFNTSPKNKTPIDYDLTDREVEILTLISEGLSYKLIADKTNISVKTVGKHIENIYGKLHVNNKVDAVNVFRQMHLSS